MIMKSPSQSEAGVLECKPWKPPVFSVAVVVGRGSRVLLWALSNEGISLWLGFVS